MAYGDPEIIWTPCPACGCPDVFILWAHYSDKKNERRWNLTASCTVMGLGCITAALLTGSYWSLAGLSLITIGLYV
jgi:hypothetical protein